MRIRHSVACGILLLALSGAALAAPAGDPCAHFAWNVTRELALFGTAPERRGAGKSLDAAPRLEADQLYQLQLLPQSQVSFPVGPQKKSLPDGAYAGVAQLIIPRAGRYRVSLDAPFWIDVVVGGKLLDATDFTGNHQCRRLAKLVEFQLPAGKAILQLSGAPRDHVRVTVTRSPPKKM